MRPPCVLALLGFRRRPGPVLPGETTSPYGAPGEPPLSKPWRPPPGGRGDLREKGWVPLRHFAFWWFLLFVGMVVFYVLLTPIWLGLRAAAWAAELRERTRKKLNQAK